MTISFDEILEERLGFGVYQYKSYGAIGFIDFVDGIEMTFSMFLPAIIQNQWKIWEIHIITKNFMFSYFFND